MLILTDGKHHIYRKTQEDRHKVANGELQEIIFGKGHIQGENCRIGDHGDGKGPDWSLTILQHRKQRATDRDQQSHVVDHRNHQQEHRIEIVGKDVEQKPPHMAQKR